MEQEMFFIKDYVVWFFSSYHVLEAVEDPARDLISLVNQVQQQIHSM